MQLQIHLLEDQDKAFNSCITDFVMEKLELLRDFLWNFKFKFKFKFKTKCYVLLMTVFCVAITGVNSTSDYVQSFERVAVFHNHLLMVILE